MGSIQKRVNGKYRARFRDNAGDEHARHFAKRKDAEAWLAEQVFKVTDGTWVDPIAGRRTFGDYATEWQAAQLHHRDSTKQITGYRLAKIVEHFGDRPLASITRTEVQAWVKSLEALKMSPASIEGLYRLLAQVMLAATDEGKIRVSPCKRINLPARSDRITIPTTEQVEAICAAASKHARPVVVLAAGSGLRVSELLGLTIDRVDWLRGIITVDRQLLRTAAGQAKWGPPKTDASHRRVPIPLELVAVLSEHLAANPSDELLFTTTTGRPFAKSSFHHEWQRWCRLAGVEGVRFHDLRHFYASSLIAAGQSVKVVQERLGHSSAKTTLDTYAHLWPADEDRTREAVSGALGGLLRTARGLAEVDPQVSGLR